MWLRPLLLMDLQVETAQSGSLLGGPEVNVPASSTTGQTNPKQASQVCWQVKGHVLFGWAAGEILSKNKMAAQLSSEGTSRLLESNQTHAETFTHNAQFVEHAGGGLMV